MRLHSIKANLDKSYTVIIEDNELIEEFRIDFDEAPEIDSIIMYMGDLHQKFDVMSKLPQVIRAIMPRACLNSFQTAFPVRED